MKIETFKFTSREDFGIVCSIKYPFSSFVDVKNIYVPKDRYEDDWHPLIIMHSVMTCVGLKIIDFHVSDCVDAYIWLYSNRWCTEYRMNI